MPDIDLDPGGDNDEDPPPPHFNDPTNLVDDAGEDDALETE